MSLFGSLFSGVSGLNAQSQSMSMISDNISNVSTTAYKGASADFSTLVTSAANVSTFSPGGVLSNTNYDITKQGLIEPSTSPTDIAIVGDGFFVVSDLADGNGDQLYTRSGGFKSDFLGNLRNPAGFFLQGWSLDSNDEIADVNVLETINVRLVNGLATSTNRVEMGANLDAAQAPQAGWTSGDMAEYNATDGVTGLRPHFSRSIQVFDSIGRAHNVTAAFLKDPATATWNVELYADSSEVEAGSHPNGLLASGQVTFDGAGALATNTLTPEFPLGSVAGQPVTMDWLDSDGAINSSIEFDLGTIGETDGLSQFAANFNVVYVTQNGAEVGQLNGVSIDDEGFVIASFSNGEQQKLYKVPVATFFNPLALDPRTGNVYSETVTSGAFNLQEAGIGGAGSISPSSLEAANVDLADEFTKMIVTQRAYSANSRVISTADEMLDELIRISR